MQGLQLPLTSTNKDFSELVDKSHETAIAKIITNINSKL